MEIFVVECGKKEDCRETITCYRSRAADFVRMCRNPGQHRALKQTGVHHLRAYRDYRINPYPDHCAHRNDGATYHRPAGNNRTAYHCTAHNCASCHRSPCREW